jgi:hypothetical protein
MQLPQHPCLDLRANSEQILSTKFSRRLVTMVKTREVALKVGFISL